MFGTLGRRTRPPKDDMSTDARIHRHSAPERSARVTPTTCEARCFPSNHVAPMPPSDGSATSHPKLLPFFPPGVMIQSTG